MSSQYLQNVNFPQGNINARVNSLDTSDLYVNKGIYQNTTVVEQAGSINTQVNCPTDAGTILTVNATGDAGSTEAFFVACPSVQPEDTILVEVGAYSGTFGTDGFPLVIASNANLAAGTFIISILNVHPTNPFNGQFTIRYHVIHELP
jgi:hypothetical protein